MPEPADLSVFRDYYLYSSMRADWGNLDAYQWAIEAMQQEFAATMAGFRNTIAVERANVVNLAAAHAAATASPRNYGLTANPTVFRSVQRPFLEELGVRAGLACLFYDAMKEAMNRSTGGTNASAVQSYLSYYVTARLGRLNDSIMRATPHDPARMSGRAQAGTPGVKPVATANPSMTIGNFKR